MSTTYISIIGVGGECLDEDDAHFEYYYLGDDFSLDVIVISRCEDCQDLNFGMVTKIQNALKEYEKATGEKGKPYMFLWSY